ncbi:hypothetical protein [Timonella sp. A28]|uniref:hypothetical protein n=1 Tax=Timonella sp. A28 TaxID=3442640 RepID=UPI003EB71848
MSHDQPERAESSNETSWKSRLTDRLETQNAVESGTNSGRGFGRLLVAVYAILAIAATARGSWQLLDHGSEAPLAYSLSLLAGIIYVIATFALAIGTPPWRKVAWAAVLFEAVGVVGVGLSSLAVQGWFPDKTVWSQFGQGYGYIPLILPFVGMLWLWRTRHHGEQHTVEHGNAE